MWTWFEKELSPKITQRKIIRLGCTIGEPNTLKGVRSVRGKGEVNLLRQLSKATAPYPTTLQFA